MREVEKIHRIVGSSAGHYKVTFLSGESIQIRRKIGLGPPQAGHYVWIKRSWFKRKILAIRWKKQTYHSI